MQNIIRSQNPMSFTFWVELIRVMRDKVIPKPCLPSCDHGFHISYANREVPARDPRASSVLKLLSKAWSPRALRRDSCDSVYRRMMSRMPQEVIGVILETLLVVLQHLLLWISAT